MPSAWLSRMQPRWVAEPGAGRAVIHLALIGLCIGHELLQRVHRQILARDQHQRDFRDQVHRREIGDRVVERLLVQRLRMRMGRDGAEDRGVTVGRSLRDAVAAHHAAGARDILDHHLLAKLPPHPLGHDPAEHVDRAAGRGRHHHRHRTLRPVLRLRIVNAKVAKRHACRDQKRGRPCDHVSNNPLLRYRSQRLNHSRTPAARDWRLPSQAPANGDNSHHMFGAASSNAACRRWLFEIRRVDR